MAAVLGFNCHGKGRVRLVKVLRKDNGVHDVIQLNVQILLEGAAMEEVFLTGDNKNVVPTDTCKNTVYCLAKKHAFTSIEEFGVIICSHFLNEHASVVNRITVDIVKDDWQRIYTPNKNGELAGHNHTFQRVGPKVFYTKVVGEKTMYNPISFSILSGLRGLEILKTTQSGFVGFKKDAYTSLPELTDRLLGTSVTCEWCFNTGAINLNTKFNKIAADAEVAVLNTFAGPADSGVYSASVQQTLFEIGAAVLAVDAALDKVVLYMPNIHNIGFPLERYGIDPKDHTGQPDIFYPIDEPHGMIKAEVLRSSGKSKL